jgi:hypothetical protein
MPYWRFRIGDVFEASDPLAVWMATLSAAINDAVHSNTEYELAATGDQAWEEFYEWRIAVSHFTEACQHLERGRAVPEVVAFLALEQVLQERFDEAINCYEDVRALAHRVRNQAAFHYAYEGGAEAVARAVTRMRNDDGSFGGEDERLRGSRWYYADELLARLVYDAAGII